MHTKQGLNSWNLVPVFVPCDVNQLIFSLNCGDGGSRLKLAKSAKILILSGVYDRVDELWLAINYKIPQRFDIHSDIQNRAASAAPVS